jgi:hypothetical protein
VSVDLSGLDATPWEISELDQVMSEVQAAEGEQRGDDDDDNDGPWHDDSGQAAGSDA